MTSPEDTVGAIITEMHALTPHIEAAKRGTEHEACEGWSLRDGDAWCSCGAPLVAILEGRRDDLT